MTSCLLAKAPRRLVAVADGRLSVSDTRRSFETTEKIVTFVPRYRIPKVSVSRFSHYSDYSGEPCYVAYAGTYALVGEILSLFRKSISERLILVWRNGEPTLSDRFDESATFIDDYDFQRADLPDFTPQIILEEFRSAAQAKIDEFCSNRLTSADCEFLLFGLGPDRRYFAYRITVDPAWAPGQSPRLQVDQIPDGGIGAIGSPLVSGTAFNDEALRDGLQGWTEDPDQVAVWIMLADPKWRELFADAPAEDPTPPLPPERNWSPAQVRARLCDLIRSTEDPSVGGILTVAEGAWSGGISVRIVD